VLERDDEGNLLPLPDDARGETPWRRARNLTLHFAARGFRPLTTLREDDAYGELVLEPSGLRLVHDRPEDDVVVVDATGRERLRMRLPLMTSYCGMSDDAPTEAPPVVTGALVDAQPNAAALLRSHLRVVHVRRRRRDGGAAARAVTPPPPRSTEVSRSHGTRCDVGHARLARAVAADRETSALDPVRDQPVGDGLRALARELLVVLDGADVVGVTADLDADARILAAIDASTSRDAVVSMDLDASGAALVLFVSGELWRYIGVGLGLGR